MKTLGYYNGKFGELDEMPVTKQELKDLLQEMVNKMDTGNLFVYYQLTRGTGIRNHVFTEGPGKKTAAPAISQTGNCQESKSCCLHHRPVQIHV